MQFFPHYLSLKATDFPQYRLLKHPQSTFYTHTRACARWAPFLSPAGLTPLRG